MCLGSVLICIGLAAAYVGSFYIWSNALDRDNPTTIKKRFLSIFVMMIASAIIVYFCADNSYFKDYNYLSLIGIRRQGFIQACIYPLLLTMVLFLGPLCVHYTEGMYRRAFDIRVWKYCICDVVWLRNHIVAPISEEFTFRACMLPILVPCFGAYCIVVCPLFFGIAHLHHLREILAGGADLKFAIFQSLFQLSYTTVFGAYSCYLFLCTGHFVAPLVAHAFCNHMGFPDFGQVLKYKQPKKGLIIFLFIVGLTLWMLLLKPTMNPAIYSNNYYL